MDIMAAARPAARFVDRPGLIGLLLKNMALNVVTLSFYRFWARANLRRHLWRRIEIAGDPLEYTGTGGELFKGFLIALGVLLPLFLVFGVLKAVLPVNPYTLAAENVVFYAVLGILYLIAVLRARRYRLSRTAWRGVRFGQDAPLGRYLRGSIGWGLLTAVTLSLAYPWWSMWRQRLLLNGTLFGDRRFACDARGGPLFKYWLVVLVTLGLGLVWYRVRETRHVAAHTVLGPVSLESRLKARVIYGRLLLLGIVNLVVLAIVIVPILFTLGVALVPNPGNPQAATAAIPWMIGAAALVTVVLTVVQQFLAWPILYIPLFRHLFATLGIEGLPSLDDVKQSRLRTGSSGEGLADAFDVGFG